MYVPGGNVVLGVLVPKQFGNLIDGGITCRCKVATLSFRVLIQENMGIAEIIQVNELALLYDRIMSFISC